MRTLLAAVLGAQLAGLVGAASYSFRTDPEYLIDTWQTEDGLPENSATAMVQTPDGYLWFGTWNGLTRFDGMNFTVLDPANTPGLPAAGIVNLHLDRRGRLWVSTLNGLAVRDGTRWRSFGTNEGWAGNLVRTFAERANGDLLLTTFDGRALELAGDRFRELPPPPGEPGHGYCGVADEAGQWWVVQNRFFGRYDGRQWVAARPPDPTVGRSAVACAPARDGGFWVLLGRELIRMRGGREVERIPVPGLRGGVWSLMEDSRTNVWISSYDGGLFRVTPRGTLRNWNTTNGLMTFSARFVFEDPERNLWVGTSGGGLSRFKLRRAADATAGSPLGGRVTHSVAPARGGDLWMASAELGIFLHRGGKLSRAPVPGPQVARIYGRSVLEDRAGRVWYGEKDGCWWRRGSANFEQVPLPWAMDDSVSALWEDSAGKVWLGSRRGAAVYADGQFREFDAASGLPAGGVTCFGEDATGVAWVAASEGVFRLVGDRFVEVRPADGQPLREVLSLRAEPDGTMWLGTRSRGLLRWRQGRLSVVGPEAGYPAVAVHAILDDGLGFYWLPSNRGIVRASRQELHAVADGDQTRLTYQLLDLNDGLPSAECATGQPTCMRDPAGRLWFATQRGVAMIDPAALRLNSLPPPVHIEQVEYYLPRDGAATLNQLRAGEPAGAPVRLQPPLPTALRLSPGSYGLEIRYAAPSFSGPAKLRFQTRLEGVGRDWEDVRGQRLARFQQLPPGDYVFRVRAANDDGLWNEAGASLAFTVLPFFWQTHWFQGVVGLLLLGAGGGVVRWRHRIRRRQELATLERLQHDLAERRRADERFRLVVEASPNGIVLVNAAGRIVLVNAHLEEQFGYTREELHGQPLEMLLPERFRGTHPGQMAAFFAAPRARLMGAGRELFGRRKDGTEFPVEIGLSPIQTDEGLLVLAAILGITARKQAEAALRDFSRRLISAYEEERTRLARELHDDVTQRLACLAIDAGRVQIEAGGGAAAETMRSVRDGLERLSKDVHALSYRLHPAVLEDLGLAEALRAECERFSRQQSVPAAVTLHEVPEMVPLETSLCLFRVAQEALRNVGRHAQANRVKVTLRLLDGGLQLAVVDDGRGFDQSVQRDHPSLGLASMRERVLLLGGELDIESSPGLGTTILVWVPIKGEKS